MAYLSRLVVPAVALGVVALGVVAWPPSAEAQGGFQGCFDDAHDVVLCNGFLAGLAGAGGALAAVGMVLSADADDDAIGLGVGAGVYALVSGGLAVGSAGGLAESDPLRVTGFVLGGVDLVLGALTLALSVAAALLSGGDDEDTSRRRSRPREPIEGSWTVPVAE